MSSAWRICLISAEGAGRCTPGHAVGWLDLGLLVIGLLSSVIAVYSLGSRFGSHPR